MLSKVVKEWGLKYRKMEAKYESMLKETNDLEAKIVTMTEKDAKQRTLIAELRSELDECENKNEYLVILIKLSTHFFV